LKININSQKNVENLFYFLNKNHVQYVWLYGHNNNRWGDIDIAMNKDDFNKIDTLIKMFCSKHGFQLLQIFQHEYCAKYFVLGKKSDGCIEYLIPDICSDYVRDNRILIKAKNLLEGSLFNGKFYQCRGFIEAEYIYLKRTLKKSWEIHHLNDFKHLYHENKSEITKLIGKYLNGKILKKFICIIEKNDIVGLNALTKKMRNAILIRTIYHNPLAYLQYKAQNTLRIVKRLLKPTGLFVVILGTDGSGKSTVISHLIDVLYPAFRKTKQYHWKPTIIQKTSNNLPVIEPHSKPPRNFLLSIIKIVVYTIEYAFGYLIKILPEKIKSTLVVFDRYYYDLLVDQKRFRIKLPKKIIKIVSYLIPKPDLIFYLNTEPSIAFERKNELNIEELEKQNIEFRGLKDLLKDHFYVIDNNGKVDAAVNEIAAIVLNNLELRLVSE